MSHMQLLHRSLPVGSERVGEQAVLEEGKSEDVGYVQESCSRGVDLIVGRVGVVDLDCDSVSKSG
jgi:hypothetical protein